MGGRRKDPNEERAIKRRGEVSRTVVGGRQPGRGWPRLPAPSTYTTFAQAERPPRPGGELGKQTGKGERSIPGATLTAASGISVSAPHTLNLPPLPPLPPPHLPC